MANYKLYMTEKDASRLSKDTAIVKFSKTKTNTSYVEVDLITSELKPDISKDSLLKAIKKVLKVADEVALKAELGL